MLPRKIFKNLHTVVAILVLLEQFSGKLCLNFLPLNLSFSPNMMHFVCTFLIMCAYCLKRMAYCYWKGLKMAGGGCIPHIPPESAPACTDNNVSYHYTNQPIWLQYDAGQILSQLFWNNNTYCTCTIWTLHLKNKGSISKGEGRVWPPWVCHWTIGSIYWRQNRPRNYFAIEDKIDTA